MGPEMDPLRARFTNFPLFAISRFFGFSEFYVFRFPVSVSRATQFPHAEARPPLETINIPIGILMVLRPGPPRGRSLPRNPLFREIRGNPGNRGIPPRNRGFHEITISRRTGCRKPWYSLSIMDGFARGGGRKARKDGNAPKT